MNESGDMRTIKDVHALLAHPHAQLRRASERLQLH